MIGKRQLLMCAGLVLLGTRGALADVVHVPIHQGVGGGFTPYYDNDGFLWWYGSSNSLNLDVNGDGIVDLTFTGSASAQTGVQTGFNNYMTARNGAAVGATYHTGDYNAWNATPMLAPNLIGPSLNYATPTATVQLFSYSGDTQGRREGDMAWVQTAETPWALPAETYLPFKFNIDGSPHYGWVCVSVVFDLTNARYSWTQVYDSAYETEANTPIAAGEVPEPGCVGAAVGVGGVMMGRRKRSRG